MKVTFISFNKDQLHRHLPLLPEGDRRPTRAALELIEMRYIENAATLRLYFASVQTLQHQPSLILVDDFDCIFPV
jgi:hypothetical protein